MSTVLLYASDTPRQTIVEEGTEFSGTIESSCPIVVNGTIQGKVSAPEITINRLGAASGVLKANRFTSNGTLSGTVEAAHVLVSGSVRSQTVIKANRLEVMLHSERGQLEVTFGSSTLDVAGSDSLSSDSLSSDSPTSDATEAWPSSSRAPAGGKTRRGRRF